MGEFKRPKKLKNSLSQAFALRFLQLRQISRRSFKQKKAGRVEEKGGREKKLRKPKAKERRERGGKEAKRAAKRVGIERAQGKAEVEALFGA
jgi:hypothetical protein